MDRGSDAPVGEREGGFEGKWVRLTCSVGRVWYEFESADENYVMYVSGREMSSSEEVQ